MIPVKTEEAGNLDRLRRSVADYRAGRVYDLDKTLDDLEIKHFGKILGGKTPRRKK